MPVSDIARAADPGTRPRTRLGTVEPYRRRQFPAVALVAVALAAVVAAAQPGPALQGVISLWLLYAMMAVGFYFIFALSGQFALSQSFFALVGGFVSAEVSEKSPVVVALLSGVAVATVLAALFALLMRRVSGLYLAMASFGLVQIGVIVVRNWEGLGGIDGTRVGVPPLEFFGREFRTQADTFWIILAAFAVVMLLGACVERSPMRRELLAVRDKPAVAATLGIPVVLVRVAVFAFGSALAALAGAIYVHWQGFASVESLGVDLSIGIFIMVLFGGSGSMWGAVLGAAFYVFAPYYFSAFEAYQDLVYGVLVLLVIVALPSGLVGAAGSARAALARLRGRITRSGAPS